MTDLSNIFILALAVILWFVLFHRLLRAFREKRILELGSEPWAADKDIDQSEHPILFFFNILAQVLLFILISVSVPYGIYRMWL